MGGELWEDAPQELRSRLWMALLDNVELVGTLTDELVRMSQNAQGMLRRLKQPKLPVPV